MMNKQEFMEELKKGLRGLPEEDINEHLTFYSEMIDDRIEEGIAEEDAVFEIGTVEKIVEQTIADTPFTKIAKERIKPKRRLKVWEIILICLGAPIWLSLGICAAAVIISLYVSLWAVLISLWAVFVSLAGCAAGGVIGGIILVIGSKAFSGMAVLSGGIICSGLSILAFIGCNAATKGVIILTKKIAAGIKNCFIKKGEA